ncbi:MAG TPA: FtsQ-type POTRA domain-containing protein [Bryobacteraceae bacterium]|jgi:cell division protein FtsQ|nr:FtsQ-type POTRA domain-containing protein [Bryobacteraceae bacterium]
MARRNTAPEPPDSFLAGIRWGRFVLLLVLGVFTMVGTLFAWRRTEDFLIKDDRFRVAEADESNGQSPNLIVEGIHYASPSQIRHVFAPDFGRSLYLVPIQERRKQLLAIDWVEEASVSKIWPDTLRASVRERSPVAFVRFVANRKDGMSQFALIDKDGYILRPRVAARFTLPVITGISETEPLQDRRARVRRVLALLNAIGPMSQQISEIDAADPNNLIAAEHVDDRVVNLMLGDENYKSRLSHFLANYAEIETKPGGRDATKFDLRIDEDITAVGENH